MGDWIGIILGLAFCLSFGYWTTNFAEASLRWPRRTSDEELHGLVYGMEIRDASDLAARAWYRSPLVLGIGVLVLNAGLYAAVYAF